MKSDLVEEDTQGLIHCDGGASATAVLASILGGRTAHKGLFRFFTHETIQQWNSPDGWRSSWPCIPESVRFFGEDCWGNQLCTSTPETGNACIWSHEDGSFIDVEVSAFDLVRYIVRHGAEWLDFYTSDWLEIADSKCEFLESDRHWHWTKPLILGGETTVENMSQLERVTHLVGHGNLWREVSALPIGTKIVLRPKGPPLLPPANDR